MCRPSNEQGRPVIREQVVLDFFDGGQFSWPSEGFEEAEDLTLVSSSHYLIDHGSRTDIMKSMRICFI